MIGFRTYGLSGLGETASSTLPEHYLTPMTRTEIDAFIKKEYALGQKSKYFAGDCKSMGGADFNKSNCFKLYLDLERYNLYYVNNIVPYGSADEPETLVWMYDRVQKGFASFKTFDKPFMKQLSEVGKVAVGAVVGFVTSGLNPVGLFVGGAGAAAKVIHDARAAKMAAAAAKLKPLANQAVTAKAAQDQAAEEKKKQDALASLQQSLPLLIGTLVVGGALIYYGDDLKKLMNKNI